jgi:excisionase family DNA binding protein
MEITFEQLPQAVNQINSRLENIERLLLETSKHSPTETDKLLTIQQAAETLCLSVPTIYGLVSRSEIPCMKKGKRLYFSKTELTDWIKAGRKKTITEIQLEADNYLSTKKGKR